MKLTKAHKYGHIPYHVCGFRATFCRETCSIDTKIIQYRAANISKYVQGWAKEGSLGCVNPASCLPLAAEREFTQPREHSFAQSCMRTRAYPFHVSSIQYAALIKSLPRHGMACRQPTGKIIKPYHSTTPRP